MRWSDMPAAMRTNMLIDQCAMWCLMTGRKPITLPSAFERSAVLMAVHQTPKTFGELNWRQRCAIAGLAKS